MSTLLPAIPPSLGGRALHVETLLAHFEVSCLATCGNVCGTRTHFQESALRGQLLALTPVEMRQVPLDSAAAVL